MKLKKPMAIHKVKYTQDELTFILKDGNEVIFNAVGDCCSQSFIEDIDCPEVFENATLTNLEVISGDCQNNGSDEHTQEVSKWTFYKFTTNKGMATLSFRNDSNGYYDGDLQLYNKNEYFDNY